MNKLKKPLNINLWIGFVSISIFVFIACIGPFVAPYETSDGKILIFEDGKVSQAPSPPSTEYWFGKDRYGRDLLSLMLLGLKYTLFVTVTIAPCRLLVGGTLGLFLGMRKKEKKGFSAFSSLSSIPLILILFGVLEISRWGVYIPIWKLLLIQCVMMILFGIPSISSTVQKKTEELRSRLSVLVSINLGATKSWIIRKHILPFLKVNLIILFVQEMIVVLNLIG